MSTYRVPPRHGQKRRVRAPLRTIQDLSECTFGLPRSSLFSILALARRGEGRVSAFAHCLTLALVFRKQKALKDRGIDKMLEEARADNKENDTEYLKPSEKLS